MSALVQKRTNTGASECPLSANSGHLQTDLRKQKDRLAAVSPKLDQVFRSGGCLLPLPAPAEQTQRAEAAGEEWQGSRQGVAAVPITSVAGSVATKLNRHTEPYSRP